MTTAHGGFYINCGELEFKARESADEDSDVEAVLEEGEKAAKKQKGPKKTTSSVGPPPKKKAKESSQNFKVRKGCLFLNTLDLFLCIFSSLNQIFL